LGGLFCNLGAAFLGLWSYRATYLIPACIGWGLLITAFFISPWIDGDARVIDMNFKKRF
jgi:hypothetical protein